MKLQEAHRHTTTRTRLPRLMLFVIFISSAALIPVSHARQQAGGRPRRTSASPQATPTPVQKVITTTTTTTTTAPKQTPSPASSPTTQGAPKLQTSPITKSDEKHEEKEQEIDPEEVVRVESNLVNLQVRVIDRNNRPLPNVSKNDFQVFENGVAQKIEFIETEEVPISYGLVIDNSGSIRHQINDVIEAGKTIISSNKPGDETFVVRFVGSEEIKIIQDFTADKDELIDVLVNDLYIEGGQTAIKDAVYLAAEHAAGYKKGNPLEDKRRRALILVTDGEDRASFFKTEQLFDSLKEEDVQIFVIGFVNELEKEGGFIRKSKRQEAVNLLDRMAKETGGRAFYPNSLAELPTIAQEITKDLRTQYVISYIPTTKARPGEFRPVRVTVADAPNHDKRIAVTRSGYTAKGGNSNAPTLNRTTAPPRRP